VTRIEGRGTVELVRVGERVVDLHFRIIESPRLFEALLLGRRYDEIADIACRICSICSTVHKVAALQAVEQAMGVTVSRQNRLLRELAVQGGQIESHALHIFCLALPDYLGVAGVPGMAVREPERLRVGLKIKKLGNHIQEIVGGRAIHPFNLLLGGVGSVPVAADLQSLKQELADIQDEVSECVQYIFSLEELMPRLPALKFCAVNGGRTLFGDTLVTSDGVTVPVKQVSVWCNEQITSNNSAKVSTFGGAEAFMVGPLARLMMAMPPEYAAYFPAASITLSLKARMVELEQAIKNAQTLIEKLLNSEIEGEKAITTAPRQGTGIAIIEAPRGTLLHQYSFDGAGICLSAQVITPTAINQQSLAATLTTLLVNMKDADSKQIKSAAEAVIRCFDPCVSCAVH
jgi:coenzyme F420-reducing hydrogenase alpha subunit